MELFTSLHPSHPGVAHVVVAEVRFLLIEPRVVAGFVACVDVADTDGIEGATPLVDVTFDVVDSSKHPNQPGVLQELVEVIELLMVLDTDPALVVVSSKHPNQPGVLHVSVLVCVCLLLVLLELLVILVLDFVELLS